MQILGFAFLTDLGVNTFQALFRSLLESKRGADVLQSCCCYLHLTDFSTDSSPNTTSTFAPSGSTG